MAGPDRFWQKVDKTDDCWLWTGGLTTAGYGNFRMNRPRRMVMAHRVSWMLHNGEILSDVHVLHRCDTPRCVRPDHLFAGDHNDNMSDMVAKGRAKAGTARKLTDDQVLALRSRHRDGESFRSLAKAYDVSYPSARSAILGEKYREVSDVR